MRTKLLSIVFILALIAGDFYQAKGQADPEEAKMYGKYGKDSVTCIMNISLYREFYKQWKSSGYKNETINDAYGPWHWVFNNCPKSTQNAYIDGIKMITYKLEKQEDEALKDKYIDTLMMIYDQRITYFGKEGYVLGRKGVDLYKYRPEAYEDVYNTLGKSVELEGNKTAGPVAVYYFRSTIAMVKDGKADTGQIVEVYYKLNDIVEFNMDKYKDKKSKYANWEIVKGNLEVTFEPFAKCEDLIPVFKKKFAESPDDIELLKKITNMLDKKKCQEDPLYFETTKKLYELEPSPESAYLIGKLFLKNGEYTEAIEYFKQAEGIEDQDLMAKAYKYIAESYRALQNYPTARTYAFKAVKLNETDGEIYIIIGDMYAESAKECGDNDLTKRVAYWAAVDKYYKAKRVDPEVEEIANKRISSYSVYFPTKETIFFYNLVEGEEYQVECWINETTKVRAAK